MANNIELSSTTQFSVRRAVFINFFIVGLCFSSWASRIPEIKGFLELDDAAWGTMLLMIPLGQIIGMSFSGWLISRVGSNRVCLVAVTFYALTLLAIGLAPTKTLFILSLISFGFFGNFCNISMNTQAVIVENFYPRPIMASFHGGWSLAGLCGGIIGLGMTIFNISTQLHFACVAVVIILLGISQYKFLQFDAIDTSTEKKDEKSEKIPFEKFLIWLGIVGFFGWAAEGTMADWNGIYLKQIVGIDEKYTPLGLMAYMVTMTIGRFVMDRATARWNRRIVLCFCGAAIFTGMFIAVLMPTFVMTLIGFMIVGLGACGVIPALYSAAGENTKIHTGRALTIVSTISFAGFLIGPPLIGYVSQLTNLRFSFAIIGIFGLLTWIMTNRIKVLRKE